MQTPEKKVIKQRTKKAIVTQDNRFIYAKYNMNANEMKFFMWIIAQINSQKEGLFKMCEIPLREIFQIWEWREDSRLDYFYCSQIIDNMAKKVYIEDFKLLDEKTHKEVKVHQAMPLFKFIRYKQGENYITYQLNDVLMQYLLDLKKDFTQLKFDDIQRMKSAYSIRIYNMLVCELKQNRQSLRINLSVLQNILEVPRTLQEYKHFNQKVLKQTAKDINGKSNIILLEIKTHKTGRKVTELEFIFDYKNNDKRITREKEKELRYYNQLIKIISSHYVGKSIYHETFGEAIVSHYYFDENEEKNKLSILAKLRNDEDRFVRVIVRNFKDINTLEKLRDKAEELFYLNKARVMNSREARKFANLFSNPI